MKAVIFFLLTVIAIEGSAEVNQSSRNRLASQTSPKSSVEATSSRRSIGVKPSQKFLSPKEVYKSPASPHILLILHLPSQAGKVYVEVYNKTSEPLSLLKLNISALGHEADLEFDDLPSAWSSVNVLNFSTLRELSIRNPQAFNQDADEIYPELVIHELTYDKLIPKLGKQRRQD